MLIVENLKINHYADSMTNDELYEFCVLNRDLQIERDSKQDIFIKSPVVGNIGFYEAQLITELEFWVRQNKLGLTFSSSTGFLLPNGAMRSPDGCWVSDERWAKVPQAAKNKFLPVVPNFIVEVRSPSDNLKPLQEKMLEWLENGVELGWLIDTQNQQSYIYRPNHSVEQVKGFDKKLNGENILKGFEFDLSELKMP
jgi:Uma2 family endonuclease